MSQSTTLGRGALHAAPSTLRPDRALGAAAASLTFGIFLAFIGLAWDVQWHNDVGPDTFFTLPHLVLYSGTALAGLSSLAAVLWYSWQQRSRQPRAAALLADAWRAPIGFIISGLGAATFLGFGFYDLWWHTIYGFDVTFESPPHIGLLLGAQIMMIGAVTVYAERVVRTQPRRAWAGPVVGLTVTLAIALGGSIPFQEIAPPFVLVFAGYKLVAALIYTAALLLIVSVVRQPGAATLLGIMVVLLRTIGWYVALWATPAYAASLDLFMRDNTLGIPEIADMIPPAILLAGILVDLAIVGARRLKLDVRLGTMLVGALAGLLIAGLHQPQIFSQPEILPYLAETQLPTLALSVVLGALAGWVGWQLGVVLRSTAD